ncbi:hypothetical protein Tco_0396983 [Tanacetum coccineum]
MSTWWDHRGRHEDVNGLLAKKHTYRITSQTRGVLASRTSIEIKSCKRNLFSYFFGFVQFLARILSRDRLDPQPLGYSILLCQQHQKSTLEGEKPIGAISLRFFLANERHLVGGMIHIHSAFVYDKIAIIHLWNVPGALLGPKGMRRCDKGPSTSIDSAREECPLGRDHIRHTSIPDYRLVSEKGFSCRIFQNANHYLEWSAGYSGGCGSSRTYFKYMALLSGLDENFGLALDDA